MIAPFQNWGDANALYQSNKKDFYSSITVKVLLNTSVPGAPNSKMSWDGDAPTPCGASYSLFVKDSISLPFFKVKKKTAKFTFCLRFRVGQVPAKLCGQDPQSNDEGDGNERAYGFIQAQTQETIIEQTPGH